MTRTIIHLNHDQRYRLGKLPGVDYAEIISYTVAFQCRPYGPDVSGFILNFSKGKTPAEAIANFEREAARDCRYEIYGITPTTIPAISAFLQQSTPFILETVTVEAEGDYATNRRPYAVAQLTYQWKPFTPAPWPKAMTVRDQYRAAYRAVRLRSTNESESARAMTGLRQWIIDRARHAYADSKYRHSSCMPQTIEFHTRTRHYLDMPAAREAAHELCGFYYRGVRLP